MVLAVLDLLAFLFQTMFSLLVILFLIELHAQNNTFKLTLKSASDFLKVRLWVINDFESEICPMRGVNINDDDSDDMIIISS